MDFELRRGFPPLSRSIVAVIAAIAVPSVILLTVLGIWQQIHGVQDVLDLALVLLIYVGQAVFLAIPIALARWRKMSKPLLGCVLLGAVLAPGPVGYSALFLMGPLAAIYLLLLLGALGAIGGLTGWAVASNFGRLTASEGLS